MSPHLSSLEFSFHVQTTIMILICVWILKGMCTLDCMMVDLDYDSLEVFLNAYAKSLAKFLPKTLCDGIMNKGRNK